MHSLHALVAYSIFAGAGLAAVIGIGGTVFEHAMTRRYIKRRLRHIQERVRK